MNSSFLKYTLFGLTITLLLPISLYAQALPKDPYANQYELISPPQPPTTPAGKVEVAEFFLYTCPHCYTFEDILALWVESKPSYVDFVKVPAVFNDNQIGMAKVYYTAEMLGVQAKINAAVFKAIHQDHRRLSNEAEMMQLFAENGISNNDFRKVFYSFPVDMKVRQAGDMTSKYGITGVPAMTVHGKYRLSSGMAGGHTQLLKLIEYLAQKEYQLIGAASVQTPPATQAPSETKESTVAKEVKEATEVKSTPEATAVKSTPVATPPQEPAQTPASTEVKKETTESSTPVEKKDSEVKDSPAAPTETPPASETKTTPQP